MKDFIANQLECLWPVVQAEKKARKEETLSESESESSEDSESKSDEDSDSSTDGKWVPPSMFQYTTCIFNDCLFISIRKPWFCCEKKGS